MKVLVFDHMEECTEQEVYRLLPLVSAQRREQALKYKHTFGQYCCLKSWLMLFDDVEMARYRDIEWSYNEHGKPYLLNGPYFSISHCKEGIAVAIDEEPVGIDIEAIRHADEDLIERTMSEQEKSIIENRKSKIEKDRTFTRLWTQKEAIVKAEGVGICSFEQLQSTIENRTSNIETIDTAKYIYSIAYGKLHCFSA